MVGLLSGPGDRETGPRYFLLTTILTSVTGFLFPVHATAAVAHRRHHLAGAAGDRRYALYVGHLAGSWRWIYVVTAMIALYLNIFVLVIQSFLKVGPLACVGAKRAAIGAAVRCRAGRVVFVVFFIAIIGAIRRFRPSRGVLNEDESHSFRRDRDGRAGRSARMPARPWKLRACSRSDAARPGSKMPKLRELIHRDFFGFLRDRSRTYRVMTPAFSVSVSPRSGLMNRPIVI